MREENTVHIPDEWLVPTVPKGRDTADAAGRYRLCFEVASGGMATVYLALYQGPMGFEKVVALKTIHKHLAKEKQFLEMFFDEARIAAHIDHPFVCRVIDFGQAAQSYYIAMEYLLGEPLSEVYEALHQKPNLAASPDVPFVFARIVADLCEGLHAAHELSSDGRSMNVVHRDVTPANLFVLFDGTVRVVDFGIATARDKLHQTELGTVKGKYAYVSPEQLELKRLDRRGDVWGLGVVLWELLTGTRLFKRETHMETMRAVGAAEVPRPSTIREGLPKELDDICMQALQRDRSERYPDARAMALDLERFLAKSGRTVSRAEIGDWLDQIFPGSATKKKQLIELTRHNDTAVPIDDGAEVALTSRFRPDEATMARAASMTSEKTEVVDDDELTDLTDEPSRPTDVDSPVSADAAETAETAETKEPPASSDADADVEGAAEAKGSSSASPAGGGAAKPKLPIRPSDRAPPRTSGARKSSGQKSSAQKSSAKAEGSSAWKLPTAVLALAAGAALAYYQPWVSPPSASTDPIADPAPVAETPSTARDARVDSGNPAVDARAMAESGEGEGTVDDDEAIDTSEWPPFDETVEDGPPGTLHVTARGGEAEVSRHGEALGHTPLEVELPPGRHRLVLRPDGGGAPRPLDVEIRSERNTFMSVSLGD